MYTLKISLARKTPNISHYLEIADFAVQEESLVMDLIK